MNMENNTSYKDSWVVVRKLKISCLMNYLMKILVFNFMGEHIKLRTSEIG
jgi:hypothetical protein